MRKRETWLTYAALVPIVVGTALASGYEPGFHRHGFIMCLTASAARALKSVLQELLLLDGCARRHNPPHNPPHNPAQNPPPRAPAAASAAASTHPSRCRRCPQGGAAPSQPAGLHGPHGAGAAAPGHAAAGGQRGQHRGAHRVRQPPLFVLAGSQLRGGERPPRPARRRRTGGRAGGRAGAGGGAGPRSAETKAAGARRRTWRI